MRTRALSVALTACALAVVTWNSGCSQKTAYSSRPESTDAAPRYEQTPIARWRNDDHPRQAQGDVTGNTDQRDKAAAMAAPARAVAQVKGTHYAGGADEDDEPDVPHAAVIPDDLGVGEELWIVADDSGAQPAKAREYQRLETFLPGQSQPVALPLAHTDVKADVAGSIASVAVIQTYTNPYAEKIEAKYVFPLPENAAVREFVMRVGERRIRSIVRKREDAERIYQAAKSQGYRAALLTQHRPNIFEQAVANIEPGKTIEIEITYLNTLRFEAGAFELVFPMVVGPRFNPSGSRAGVGVVPFGGEGSSGQPVETQYLPPGERSGHDISLEVDVDAGMPIEDIDSPSHAVLISAPSASRRHVVLSPLDSLPNKDFRLRYEVAGSRLKSGLVTHVDNRGGFFSLLLVPPASLADLPPAPVELVFVVDCSGSMSGLPLDIAKGTVERALHRLDPSDTFQIVRFSDSSSALGAAPIVASPENVRRGIDYLRGLNSEGGTMMVEGIKAALDFRADPHRQRIVSFVTDGYIGNEAEILGEIHKRLGATRIFSFGVGSSTNRYLLEQMAIVGHGAAAFVGLDEGSARAADGFYEAIAHPALTDIKIDWSAIGGSDVFPRRIPDLFVGRPIVLSGRFDPKRGDTLRLHGRVGGESRTYDLNLPSKHHRAVADLWARSQIAQLDDDEVRGRDRRRAITELALTFGLASKYTSFVAVDSSERTAGNHGVTIVQPVPMPDGVRYDTTVAGER